MSLPSAERRVKPRLHAAFRAVVRGRRTDGGKFEEETWVENMSATGIYFSLQSPVRFGTRLLTLVFMAPSTPGEPAHPTIAALAAIVRTELLPDGSWGVGARLIRHRFL